MTTTTGAMGVGMERPLGFVSSVPKALPRKKKVRSRVRQQAEALVAALLQDRK